MQMHHRIQRDDATLSRFTHHLPMHLAAGRHVHHEVSLNEGVAGQSVSRGQMLAPGELLLGCSECIYVRRARVDPMLWKVTFHDEDLTPSAQAPSATNRVDIAAEGTRRLKEGRPDRKSSALT